jgi:hypothetical protein
VATIHKITNPTDRARARRLNRPRHALNRAATEQAQRYVTRQCRHAQLRGVSHRIFVQAPDGFAELVLHIIARAG